MFIQMIQGECAKQDEMRGLVDEWCGLMADQVGWLGGTYGWSDDGRFVGVARYESRDACTELGAMENGKAVWDRITGMIDGVEIHESEDVMVLLDGGSDDAGFVQVMRGRVNNADALRQFAVDDEMTSMLHQARPEIIGATLAIEDDGTFTETVAFTDEASAREGETTHMPDAIVRRMEESMADVEFIDLHQPWFASHK